MRQIDGYKKIEIELTSHCNLACPGCARTLNGSTNPKLELASIPYDTFIERFSPDILKDKFISFCGVYGDPLMHKHFFEIAKYCVESKAKISVDTNASLQSKEWWNKLGELSNSYSNKQDHVFVRFSVDGHNETNHLYRVRSNFEKILTNMNAYINAGGKGEWKYIVFPHNQHEVDKATHEAKKIGIHIEFENNTREPDESWPTFNMIEKETKIVSKIKKIEELDVDQKHEVKFTLKDITDTLAPKNIKTRKYYENRKAINSIKCEWLADSSLFVGYDGRVWPCCYFQNEYHQYYLWPNRSKKWRQTGEYLHTLDHHYGKNWNNINHNSIEKIVSNDWFKYDLKESLSTKPHFACTFNCKK